MTDRGFSRRNRASTASVPADRVTAQGEAPRPSVAGDHPLSWIVFSLARSHRALAASLLGPLGLFPGQELMLMQLWDRDGRSQKELGDLQQLDHSTVAKSVQRLERVGLVTRTPCPWDGRVRLVHLTEKGRLLERAVRDALGELEGRITSALDPQQQQVFITLAGLVVDATEETARGTGISDGTPEGQAHRPPGSPTPGPAP